MADLTVPIALVVAALAILVPLVRGSHRDDVIDRDKRADLDRAAAEIRGQILARLGHLEVSSGETREAIADLRVELRRDILALGEIQSACQAAHREDSDQIREMILGPRVVVTAK